MDTDSTIKRKNRIDERKMETPRNHMARLAVSMQVLEDTISEVEEIIMNSKQRKIMTENVDNLSPWGKAMILRRIEELRELINYMAQKLNLQKRKEETKNMILGAMTIQCANLEEIQSKRLESYGGVPDELREFLDPKVDKMMRLVNEICKIASLKDKRDGL